jgi:lipopolysaccharide biosynthesis glycosyltransferase
MKQKIPIFFSVDEKNVPYLAVALNSIRENASPRYLYDIHIVINSLTSSSRARLSAFQSTNFTIEFNSLTQSHFSPLFIPALFPQYDKGIYLDADVIVPGDISWLWEEPLGNKYLGAVEDYTNCICSGVLLMNLKAMRENDITGNYLHWLSDCSQGAVTPVQDCLNAICGHNIQYLDPCWNCIPSDTVFNFDNPLIIHYSLASKPWLNETVPYDELYWHYAKDSGYYDEIRARRTAFLFGPHNRIPISE